MEPRRRERLDKELRAPGAPEPTYRRGEAHRADSGLPRGDGVLLQHNKYDKKMQRRSLVHSRFGMDMRRHSTKKRATLRESLALIMQISNKEEAMKNGGDEAEEDDPLSCREIIELLLSNRYLVFFISWFIWMLVGTIYYSLRLDLGYMRGFYFAVNVGYSIGYGDMTETIDQSQIFSTVYVIVGASFIGAGLGFFAEKILSESDDWYLRAQQEVVFETHLAGQSNMLNSGILFIRFHWNRLRVLVLWLLFIIICVICCIELNDWSFTTALYFAVSSLSTGGLVSLPLNSPDSYYFAVGLYGAFGIPIMALAMGNLASFFIDSGDMSDTLEAVTSTVTAEEVEKLRTLGLEDGDGQLDKSEFIILCLLRLGTDPELISFVEMYFRELDVDNSGFLTLEELQNPKVHATKRLLTDRFKKRAAKLFNSKKHEKSVAGDVESQSGTAHITTTISPAHVSATIDRPKSAKVQGQLTIDDIPHEIEEEEEENQVHTL